MRHTIQSIAISLAKDLNCENLHRYIAEQERMIQNENKFNRCARKYIKWAKAGRLALKLVKA